MKVNLTSEAYWNSNYHKRQRLYPVSLCGFRNYCFRLIYERQLSLINHAETVLELGGGGSSWLACIAKLFPFKNFTCLDFSPEGNQILSDYCQAESLTNIAVIDGDFFDTSLQIGLYDHVYSFGVAEHFTDLELILNAHVRFLAPGGTMFVAIPNMRGILGTLTRFFDISVFDMHVPYGINELTRGHLELGLEILDSGYLCSSNFAVLSSCIGSQSGPKLFFYRVLNAISLCCWWLEDRLMPLPATPFLSPYLYVISRRRVPD